MQATKPASRPVVFRFLVPAAVLAASWCFTSFLFCVHAQAKQTISYPHSDASPYVVLLKGSCVLHYDGSIPDFPVAPQTLDGRADVLSETAQRYAAFLIDSHDLILQQAFGEGAHTTKKLYSYHYLLNGFAAWLTSEEAAMLQKRFPQVISVEKDSRVQKFTTYTPRYMGLPGGAWADNGGVDYAGEGIVIGLVDTGINPFHPSFSDSWGSRPYTFPKHFTGNCEVTTDFPAGSCNNKLVGARHFSAALMASGIFNASVDSASPLDGDGHGTHTASIAAGNSGVPVTIDGLDFGFASGMAPRAHIAMYKSMFRNVGGYFADTVAAMEQAVQDGVDILSLSIGPARPPNGVATFFSVMEMAALSAVKAGVFVVQAAGNAGPFAGTVASFSPWIFTVAAAFHNRSYHNSILLSNHVSIRGFGLSPGTDGTTFYKLVLASNVAKMQQQQSYLRTNSSEQLARTCQDSSVLDVEMVRGCILVCRYTADFLADKATLHGVILTAKELFARGVILVVDKYTADSDMKPFPSTLPIVLVPSLEESTMLLSYFTSNSNFDLEARILGGLSATYDKRSPEVAYYSSRGPDLANNRGAVAEVMKPDAMAPGDLIWGAWSPIGNDDDFFTGKCFALGSGTSMAAPHVAGIAALMKQKNPRMSPAAIGSALTSTASAMDHQGFPLLAQQPSYNLTLQLGPASPFDFGGGEVNPTAAIDPGLVFDAGFGDYVGFLCSIQGGEMEVMRATGTNCNDGDGVYELNQPSITIANLIGRRVVRRRVSSVAMQEETYRVSVDQPEGVQVSVRPTVFKVPRGSSDGRRQRREAQHPVHLAIGFTATSDSSRASFGSLILSGSRGHVVRMPLSVISRALKVS